MLLCWEGWCFNGPGGGGVRAARVRQGKQWDRQGSPSPGEQEPLWEWGWAEPGQVERESYNLPGTRPDSSWDWSYEHDEGSARDRQG